MMNQDVPGHGKLRLRFAVELGDHVSEILLEAADLLRQRRVQRNGSSLGRVVSLADELVVLGDQLLGVLRVDPLTEQLLGGGLAQVLVHVVVHRHQLPVDGERLAVLHDRTIVEFGHVLRPDLDLGLELTGGIGTVDVDPPHVALLLADLDIGVGELLLQARLHGISVGLGELDVLDKTLLSRG